MMVWWHDNECGEIETQIVHRNVESSLKSQLVNNKLIVFRGHSPITSLSSLLQYYFSAMFTIASPSSKYTEYSNVPYSSIIMGSITSFSLLLLFFTYWFYYCFILLYLIIVFSREYPRPTCSRWMNSCLLDPGCTQSKMDEGQLNSVYLYDMNQPPRYVSRWP